MWHCTIKKHAMSVNDQQQGLMATQPQKMCLLKQYIKQLELHIAYLQRELDRYRATTYFKSVGEILINQQKQELLEQNKILNGQCMIKEEELLLVIEDNRLLTQKLSQITGQQKNRTIQMLVEMNKRLQQVNIENQKQISEYGKLQIMNNQMRLEIQNISKQCQTLKDQLFDKRHAYTKYKLCMTQLKSLQAKYLRFDPTYKSILSYYK